MFYFLILLVPFLGFLAFTIRLNAKLRRQYLSTARKLVRLSAQTGHPSLLDHFEYAREIVITDESVIRLEKGLHLLEEVAGLKRSATVALKFGPKKKKLGVLEENARKLEKALSEQLQEAGV